MIKFIVFAGIFLMGVYLVRQYLRDQQSLKYAKTHLFDEAITLLEQAQLKQEGADFPQMTGYFLGYEVKLTLIEDTLAVRKIPPLWLMVSIKGKAEIEGSFDLIVRPSNQEFYSPAWQWDGNLQVPSHWPQHAVVQRIIPRAGIGWCLGRGENHPWPVIAPWPRLCSAGFIPLYARLGDRLGPCGGHDGVGAHYDDDHINGGTGGA